jgi:hypothetical protein
LRLSVCMEFERGGVERGNNLLVVRLMGS